MPKRKGHRDKQRFMFLCLYLCVPLSLSLSVSFSPSLSSSLFVALKLRWRLKKHIVPKQSINRSLFFLLNAVLVASILLLSVFAYRSQPPFPFRWVFVSIPSRSGVFLRKPNLYFNYTTSKSLSKPSHLSDNFDKVPIFVYLRRSISVYLLRSFPWLVDPGPLQLNPRLHWITHLLSR